MYNIYLSVRTNIGLLGIVKSLFRKVGRQLSPMTDYKEILSKGLENKSAQITATDSKYS